METKYSHSGECILQGSAFQESFRLHNLYDGGNTAVTTNIIEGLNRQFRKITKNKPSFTNDDSLRKMLYLASQNIVNHWTVVCRNWDMVSNQLRILFEDRETV